MPTFSTSQTVLPSAAISRIESGSLAELNVPNLMLKKGEKCCFVDKSYEMVETTTTRNIRKSGGTSMPSVFFKGVRYHMGSSESVPVTETKVDYIPGYLYITNKRIIFTSYNKIVVFIDRSPAECYNKFRMLWIGGTSPTAKTVFGRLQPQLLC